MAFMVQRGPHPRDEFLTVAEVAALLKLNQQTIRNWIDAGTLPAVRIGRRVRILRRDLDELLERSQGPRAAADRMPVAAAFWSGEVVPQLEDVALPDAGSEADAGPPPTRGADQERGRSEMPDRR